MSDRGVAVLPVQIEAGGRASPSSPPVVVAGPSSSFLPFLVHHSGRGGGVGPSTDRTADDAKKDPDERERTRRTVMRHTERRGSFLPRSQQGRRRGVNLPRPCRRVPISLSPLAKRERVLCLLFWPRSRLLPSFLAHKLSSYPISILAYQLWDGSSPSEGSVFSRGRAG